MNQTEKRLHDQAVLEMAADALAGSARELLNAWGTRSNLSIYIQHLAEVVAEYEALVEGESANGSESPLARATGGANENPTR